MVKEQFKDDATQGKADIISLVETNLSKISNLGKKTFMAIEIQHYRWYLTIKLVRW